MHVASIDGNLEIIKILAPVTEEPNVNDDGGLTPIHIAVEQGDLKIVQFLAPLAKNLDSTSSYGGIADETAAVLAYRKGHLDMFKILAPFEDEKRLRNIWIREEDSKQCIKIPKKSLVYLC